MDRVTRTKEEARISYDRLSRWYDLLAGSERRYTDAGLDRLKVKEGEIVLEIGFGTGHGLTALAQAVGNPGKVYGIDLSEGMIHVALARVKAAGWAGRVELMGGDAATLPFSANQFHAILMSFTLELFDTPEIPLVLQECARVLRQDGRVGLVALSRKGKVGLMVRLYEWAHRKFPRYFDCRPIFVQDSLEATGFQVLDAMRMSVWGLPVEIIVAKRQRPHS